MGPEPAASPSAEHLLEQIKKYEPQLDTTIVEQYRLRGLINNSKNTIEKPAEKVTKRIGFDQYE